MALTSERLGMARGMDSLLRAVGRAFSEFKVSFHTIARFPAVDVLGRQILYEEAKEPMSKALISVAQTSTALLFSMLNLRLSS